MTQERWQLIDRLFQSAIELAPDERADFIREACAGDDSLQAEVVSLVAAHERSGEFLDAPAYEVASTQFANDLAVIAVGQTLGHYKILGTLGAGGMGEVYLAQDTKLGRKIALKLLPAEFTIDKQRVRRFEQEARAASTLNHPNVCVIHEIGKTEDGRHFIAMEHIDGTTLRKRMTQKLLNLSEALDVAVQIAAALEAAHAAGIIHRDIKPENIMLRRDGYVKVLDFGLAKLNENLSNLQNISEATTLTKVQTEPGTRMGTVKYMSPEQLRELAVDERTDIWSFGVVLHEMVTGITPFEAPTTNDTIALILEKQPLRLAFHPDEVPAEFQQIVKKALAKKREERYQTVKDLASDLKRLHQQIKIEPSLEPQTQPMPNSVAASSGGQQATASNKNGLARVHNVKPPLVSSAEYVLSEIKKRPKAAIFTGVAAILVILFIGRIPLSLFVGQTPQSSLPQAPPLFQTTQMAPFTNSGKSVCAAISLDGRYIAHAEERDGMQELLLTGLATAGTAVVAPRRHVKYLGVTFSRDGNYLYFTLHDEKSDDGLLYQIALPGSASKRIKDGVDSPITFSPKGDRFSFVRFHKTSGEYSLIVAEADGPGERVIAIRREGDNFSIDGPAWSPDGKTIACAAAWWDNGYHMKLIEVDVEDGHERPISEQQWFKVLQVAWLEDKSALIISAREQPLSPYQLWRVSYPQGEAVKITHDIADYETVSLSGDKIVSVRSGRDWKIWVAPDRDAQRATVIASGVGYIYGLNWTGKEKLVFSAMAQDKLNISLIDHDGSNQTQLTVNAGDNYSPVTSPDGRFIVFASNRTGSFNIWRMNADDGSDPKQLTFSDGNFYPSCSSDSQWVFYDNQSSATLTLWKVSIEGGKPVQLTDKYARMPVVSPDNQFIACRYYIGAGLMGIAILPLAGGSPIKLVPIPIMDWQRVQWTADGRALTYVNTVSGTSNIWSYDLHSGAAQQLTDFKSDQIFTYAWSPDYKQLACVRGTTVSDVTIIRDQR